MSLVSVAATSLTNMIHAADKYTLVAADGADGADAAASLLVVLLMCVTA